ncbi:hypothetical protein FQA45_00160 [Glutamicibacter halophytocola]|uniref:DUF3037 domain-containing protein n=1 Tax=Glutamicibacter halophytocola TaxID=1933880 RepID=A0ABX5Y8R9_9MICC|nr:hypothetical protein [Glutamicibacter halophytocola]QDY64849.1 hypothetical protein FQA45_00160 [Glutamicibacter halophytocola]
MAATLYLIQHFHDLRLHEGRNIGVAVVDEASKVHLRLGGISPTGEYDRGWLRRFNLSTSYYASWSTYLQDAANSGTWDDVLAFQAEKPTNIIARNVGISLRDTDDWSGFADRYFLDMVDSQSHETDSFTDKVRRFLGKSQISVKEKVKLEGKWDAAGEVALLEFPFGIETRRGIDVLAAVPLKNNSVYSFKAAVDAVQRIDRTATFVALTSYNEDEVDSERVNRLLMPLEAGSNPVNIDSADAVENLHDILTH